MKIYLGLREERRYNENEDDGGEYQVEKKRKIKSSMKMETKKK